MAIAFVQKGSALATGAAGNTVVSCAYGSNVVAGNLLVAAVFLGDPSTTPAVASVADTQSNTWNSATISRTGGTSNSTVQIYFAIAGSSASCNVSATISGAASTSGFAIHIFEFSGTALSSVQDGSGASALTVSTSPSVTLTVASSGSLIVAAANNSAGTPTVGSGYTAGPTPQNPWSADQSEYNVNVSSGSIAAGFTTSGGGTGLVAAAFKPATVTATTKQLLMLGAG